MIDRHAVETLANALCGIREGKGRVFVIGLGGSYANAEHAAADLRKLCDIQAYAPNVAEMSAWANDSGAKEAFTGFLNWMQAGDALLVLSVGGGTTEVSAAIHTAVEKGRRCGSVFGIVGPDGGRTAELADVVVKIPAPKSRVTPHTEAFQSVVWHLLVSHPLLQRNATKW